MAKVGPVAKSLAMFPAFISQEPQTVVLQTGIFSMNNCDIKLIDGEITVSASFV
jgi:hypothetical protein